MSIAQMVASEYGGARDVSAIGGVETGRDAAEFILLGANSVQVPLSLTTSQRSRAPQNATVLLQHVCRASKGQTELLWG